MKRGRSKGKGKGKNLGPKLFGATPKKPEPDDVPGRDTRMKMQSGFPAGAPRKKTSARAKKRLESYRL